MRAHDSGMPARWAAATSIAASSLAGFLQEVDEDLGRRGSLAVFLHLGRQLPLEVSDRLLEVATQECFQIDAVVLEDVLERWASLRRPAGERGIFRTRSSRPPAQSPGSVANKRHSHHGRKMRDVDVIRFVGEEPGATARPGRRSLFPAAARPARDWRSRRAGWPSARRASGESAVSAQAIACLVVVGRQLLEGRDRRASAVILEDQLEALARVHPVVERHLDDGAETLVVLGTVDNAAIASATGSVSAIARK